MSVFKAVAVLYGLVPILLREGSISHGGKAVKRLFRLWKWGVSG